MEWKEVRLGDICKSVCSGGTPKSTNSSYYGGDILWLNTKEIDFNRIYRTEKTITEEGLNNSSAKWIEENTVSVAMYGATAGKSCIVKVPLTTNQACCNLTIDEKKADYEYVYYSLKNSYIELASLANGGAQQNLNAQIIKDFMLLMPSLSDQRRIASILSSLDSKIETNNKINAKLEEMAQALFKSWFVDNDCTSLVRLEDICLNVTDGVHNSVKDEEGSKYLLLSCKNIVGGRLKISSSERSINEETFLKLRKRTKLEKRDILISTVGTVGEIVLLSDEPSYFEFQRSVGIVKVDSEQVSPYFVYLALKNKQTELKHIAHGAVQQCIFISDLKDFKIIKANKELIDKFDKVVKPIFENINVNEQESSRLASLRDTLLPKLMSGAIEI